MSHTFHIPVLGLGFSIDTPLKVARYGISSVVSIVDDQLIERMRKFHSPADQPWLPIKDSDTDHRAKRITAYLNLLQELVLQQHAALKLQPFLPSSDITRYFEMLPQKSLAKWMYEKMLQEPNPVMKSCLQNRLRRLVAIGATDVNIMAKVDKINYSKDGSVLGERFSDALASLRGFANSRLNSSIVLSAGLNPRLYSYLEEFEDFFPSGGLPSKKKIILKVSDYRSAFIQAKFLAKKGLWVSEFRIESGLNCGGHAFATEGYLLGPILEEFKEKRQAMLAELADSYQAALRLKEIPVSNVPQTRITVQGGIGTAEENKFLQEYYQLDGTGWGSPFLLVPEATNVDEATLSNLVIAKESDFYISGSSPLGIPFNNFRNSTSEQQRLERIAKGRPGSPCTKKYLVSNTEFTEQPICTASREFQNLKLKQLQEQQLTDSDFLRKAEQITEKICLCQDLSTSVYIKNGMLKPRENQAVAICPGPNTAYFSGTYTLSEMVNHIYGRINLLENVNRSHVFQNELKLYIDYLKRDLQNSAPLNEKKARQLQKFRDQLLNGIEYYLNLFTRALSSGLFSAAMQKMREEVAAIQIPGLTPATEILA